MYRNVFDKIAAEDMEFADESDFEIHGFGTSTSTYEEVTPAPILLHHMCKF